MWKVPTLTNAYACPVMEGIAVRLVGLDLLQLIITNNRQHGGQQWTVSLGAVVM